MVSHFSLPRTPQRRHPQRLRHHCHRHVTPQILFGPNRPFSRPFLSRQPVRIRPLRLRLQPHPHKSPPQPASKHYLYRLDQPPHSIPRERSRHTATHPRQRMLSRIQKGLRKIRRRLPTRSSSHPMHTNMFTTFGNQTK